MNDISTSSSSSSATYTELKIRLDIIINDFHELKQDIRDIKYDITEKSQSILELTYRMNAQAEEIRQIKKERRFFYILGAIIVGSAILAGPEIVHDLVLMAFKRI